MSRLIAMQVCVALLPYVEVTAVATVSRPKE